MSTSKSFSGTPELRQHPRKNVLEWPPIGFEMLVADDARPVQRHRGVILNLSEGGISVQPFRPLALGVTGWLQLGVPGADKPLMTEGRVAWVGRNGRVGIRFVEAPGEDRDLLRRWLSHKPLRQTQAVPPSTDGVPENSSEFDAALQLIAERARFVCRASGAAIAVGDKLGMECRASSGSAPDVGIQLRPDMGLSGHCLTTGKLVNCADVRSDPRVDSEAARRLEMRSVLILPASVSGEIAGVLEVFSPQPHAFDKRQISRLKQMLALIGAAIEEDRAQEWDLVQAEKPAEIPEIPVPQTTRSEWLPTEWLSKSREILGFKEESPDEESPANTPEAAGDDFRMMSYVDSPSFQSPMFAAKTGIGFLVLAAVIAFGWHAVHPRNPRPAAVAAATSDNADQEASVPQQIVLKLGPPKITKKVGSTFTVEVTLDGAKNVSSVPIEIQYDPKLLQLVNVWNGDLLIKDRQSVALVHREQGGVIQVTATRPPSAPGAAGSGTVFTLIFLAKAPGKSNLSTKPATLRDSKMNPISVDSAETSVTIKG